MFESENPVVVEHEDGHRPVKILTKERLEVVANFLIKQYLKKNSTGEEV